MRYFLRTRLYDKIQFSHWSIKNEEFLLVKKRDMLYSTTNEIFRFYHAPSRSKIPPLFIYE